MDEIRTAVIDGGVDIKFPGVNYLEFNMRVTNQLSIRKCSYDYKPNGLHGSFCAAIIKKYESLAKIGSIEILDKRFRTNTDKLCIALEWCCANAIQIANISLGSIMTKDFDKIEKSVNYATSHGLIIIAASSNDDSLTYPACLNSVIGVKASQNYVGDMFRRNEKNDGVDFVGSARHDILPIEDMRYKYTPPNNSYAAPLITSKVIKIMKNGITKLSDIRNELYKMEDNHEKDS